jgi:hypothetical protein
MSCPAAFFIHASPETPMPAPPTTDQLTPLVTLVKELIGDASTGGCDCESDISDRQILAALADNRDQVLYDRANTAPTYGPGGGISFSIHRFEPYLAGNARLLDASYTEIPAEDIAYTDPLHGTFETASPALRSTSSATATTPSRRRRIFFCP